MPRRHCRQAMEFFANDSDVRRDEQARLVNWELNNLLEAQVATQSHEEF